MIVILPRHLAAKGPKGSTSFLRPHVPARFLHQSSTKQSARMSSSSSFKPMPLHPRSQLVLQHLQGTWSDWIQSKGLDQGLKINSDGTFKLNFPRPSNGWIMTSHDKEREQHWLKVQTVNGCGPMFSRYKISDTPPIPNAPIWECTTYEKKIRKRSIWEKREPQQISEKEATQLVEDMIVRLTRWGI